MENVHDEYYVKELERVQTLLNSGKLSEDNFTKLADSLNNQRTSIILAEINDKGSTERCKATEAEITERHKAAEAETTERHKAAEAEATERHKVTEAETTERHKAAEVETTERHKAAEAEITERHKVTEAEATERHNLDGIEESKRCSFGFIKDAISTFVEYVKVVNSAQPTQPTINLTSANDEPGIDTLDLSGIDIPEEDDQVSEQNS